MLRCVALCYVVLCCVVLCCAVLCCAVRQYVAPCYAIFKVLYGGAHP